MKFPNAFSGVKKIFTAEILSLLGGLATLLAGIFTVTAVGTGVAAAASESDGLASTAGASLIGAGAFILAAGVLYLISFILQLIGLSNASKDESAFKTAMIFVFVGIACSLVASFTQSNGEATALSSIFSSLQQVSSLCVTIFTIQGIRNLADKLNNGEMSAKGATIFKIITVIYLLIIVAGIIAIFSLAIAGILTIVASVLSVIQYIIFLSYLAKAKKMLA